MALQLGEQLRELRRRDGRTQDDLAQALDVTPQAVSRWENDICYPDVALLPSIANYFGVAIDELFGYKSDRDRKIDAIIQKVDAFQIKSRGDDDWVDECLGILRSGLAEFPQDERLRLTLASTLSEAGWRKYHEHFHYDDDGYLLHDYAQHWKNPYWAEAVEICESLIGTAKDHTVVTEATSILVPLYRNLGETKKAAACANRMPELTRCREALLASAADGKDEAKYIGDFLLKLAGCFSKHLVYGLMANLSHYQSDLPLEKVKGAISLFYLLCGDGNLGKYHDEVISLYLYLSRLQWERGYHDDAFVSLENALKHARALEALADGEEHTLTAPLVSLVKYRVPPCGGIADKLPEDWPFWSCPEYSGVEEEIKADPRWDAWVKQCRNT